MKISNESARAQDFLEASVFDSVKVKGSDIFKSDVSVLSKVCSQDSVTSIAGSDCGRAELASQEEGTVLVRSAGEREVKLTQKEDGRVQLKINRPEIKTLVLSGGGAKGIAYPGAIQALEQRGVLDGINTVSGASAGAIAATVLASGMGAEGFKELSNNLDLIGLLDSPNKNESLIQKMFSVAGNILKKAWGMLGLMLNILPRVQSSAVPLENLLVEKSRESVLRQIGEHPEVAKEPKVVEIKTRLDNGGEVTFGDLAFLSKHISSIKELNITGTAMFEGKAQMVVFNSSLTPDMSIARAAHISSALPVVFAKVDEQGHPFQEHGEHTFFQDGGIMFNTPVPELFDRCLSEGPLRNSDNLILKFESKKSNEDEADTHKVGMLTALKDWFLGAPNTAQGMSQARGLEKFKDQLVIVPLKTDFGDFRGMLSGTVNFFMSDQEKLGLQKLLCDEVEKHLDARIPTTHDFSTLEEALLALNDKMFASVLAQAPSCAEEINQFRQDARAGLLELTGAIATAESASGDLKMTKEIATALEKLDALSSNSERGLWLAKALNEGDNTDFNRLLTHAGNKPIDSSVLSAAVGMMKQKEAVVFAEHVIREVIEPALCRYGQLDSNIELLLRAKDDLAVATSKDEVNKVLNAVVDNYEARNKTLFAAAIPKTVEMAMAWRTPRKDA